MIHLALIAALLSQADDQVDVSRYRLVGIRHRNRGLLTTTAPPQFEFAPSNGAGMPGECFAGSNNWLAQSNSVGTSPWTTINGTAAAPTLTLNYLGGGYTRVQVPAVAAAQYSNVTQNTLSPQLAAGITYVFSAKVKGTSGSGTMYINNRLAGAQTCACSYNAATDTTCTCTFSSPGTGDGIDFGSNGYINPPTGALDFLIKETQLELGGVPTTYLATTTASVVPTKPTGSKGESMTFSRASAATCTRGTNGFRTTSIANGDIVYVPTNFARPERQSNGALGLLVETQHTNSLLRSEDFTDPVWSALGEGGATAPTVTANQAIAPDGQMTADRIQFQSCAGANSASKLQQAVTVGTATQSLYLKGVSGSGSIGLCAFPNGCSQHAFGPSSWTRINVQRDGDYFMFGCVNQQTGGANTGAADVYVWGAEWDNSPVLTAYIPTTSAAVTRAVELAYVPYTTTNTSGSMSCTVTYLSNNADKGWCGAANGGAFKTMLYQGNPGAVAQYIGSTFRGATTTTPGSPQKMAMSWSAGASQVCNAGSCTATTAATETPPVAQIDLLQYGADSTKVQDGIISNVCYDPSVTKCAP